MNGQSGRWADQSGQSGFKGKRTGFTYPHVVVVARRPQRRLWYDIGVAGLLLRWSEPRGLDIAGTATLWKT
jgi:hypothetical protein